MPQNGIYENRPFLSYALLDILRILSLYDILANKAPISSLLPSFNQFDLKCNK